MNMLSTRGILDDIAANLETTVEEIIGFAQEDVEQEDVEQEKNRLTTGLSLPTLFLVDAAQHRPEVDQYVFELLKAFGCCAHGVTADDEDSRRSMRELEQAHPSFEWVKNIYQQAIELDEINPQLVADPQGKTLAQDRLVAWLA